MNPGPGDWVQTPRPFVWPLLSHLTTVPPCGKPGRDLRQSPVSAGESLSVPSRTPSRDTLPRAALSAVLHRRALRSPAGRQSSQPRPPCASPGPLRHLLPPRPLVPGGKAKGAEGARCRRLQGVPRGARGCLSLEMKPATQQRRISLQRSP